MFDKARGVALGSPEKGGFGDSGDLRYAAAHGIVGAKSVPRASVAIGSRTSRTGAVQGPVFGTLTLPGKIDDHAVTLKVCLWRGSRRIEFGVELNTSQPDNGIFCIRFPIGMSGKVVAGIPFGVESRDNLEQEIFRGESFATGFPEGYDATRWTDVSSPKDGVTRSSVRPACTPDIHSRRASSRSSSFWTTSSRRPRTCLSGPRRR